MVPLNFFRNRRFRNTAADMAKHSLKTRIKRSLLALVAMILLVLIIPYLWSRMASPWRQVAIHASQVVPAPGEPERIRIVTYNIAHGRGQAQSNWQGGSQREREQRLKEISELLRDIDADIVVLNEVDFDSSWSYHVNQARYLAEHAGYPYWVEQRNLDFRVAIWTWRFGNAILSRYALSEAQVIDVPALSQSEAIFVGSKRCVLCRVQGPHRPFRIIGAHLSHRSESTRAKSARMIVDLVTGSPIPTVIAGDLNSTPAGFPQHQTDPHEGNALSIIDESSDFQRRPVEPPSTPDGFTFDTSDPKSIIDWILPTQDWEIVNYDVIASRLSDHRPVVVDLRWRTKLE